MTGPTDRPIPDVAELAARRAAKAERAQRRDLATVLTTIGIAAVVVVVTLVFRLLEIFGSDGIRVPVQFVGLTAAIPDGVAGAEVQVSDGVVVVSDLPVATFASVVLAAVLPAAASLIVIVCAALVFRRLWRGETFAPGTARLVTIASFAILGGWFAASLFGTMASNGALALLTDDGDFSVTFEVTWLPVLAALALAGLAIAFRAGERLRADTDGLV
ncbi:MAG TPA: hypothetical protein VNJ54_19220 [Plantibacter sp.]|uniref:hypothetical protein n=1 Tax=unclassified Plantibacter TaxID=2624265 RepID=UPI002CDF77CD|nr:hypothetical protein [Plantibacter sp.]